MNETDLVVRGAAVIGERLVSDAIWHDGRCTWLTHDIDESGETPVVIERSAGADLYQGTAGIGWALAHLAARTHDQATAATARGALRHALANAPDDDSLHGGRAGIAYAGCDAATLLGDEELLGAARSLAVAVADRCRHGADTGWDLMGGAAGTALALMSLPGDQFIDAALELARRLAAGATVADEAWSWPSPGSVEPPLCGLGHGAAGVATTLAAVARAADTREFDAAIHGALDFERTWFDRSAGWPDLRGFTRLAVHSGQRPGYPVHWCHGASGAGIARLRIANDLGTHDPRCSLTLTEAAAALDLSTSAALRALADHEPRHEWLANVSLCHGIGSVAELQLAAYRYTGDDIHLRHAQRLMLKVLGIDTVRAVADHDPCARLTALPCGIPGAPEVPGLMVGTAGVLSLLLRLSQPDTAHPAGLPAAA